MSKKQSNPMPPVWAVKPNPPPAPPEYKKEVDKTKLVLIFNNEEGDLCIYRG